MLYYYFQDYIHWPSLQPPMGDDLADEDRFWCLCLLYDYGVVILEVFVCGGGGDITIRIVVASQPTTVDSDIQIQVISRRFFVT